MRAFLLTVGFYIGVLLSAHPARAASTPTAPPDAVRQRLNPIFANINKTHIPTGHLEEFGAGIVPLTTFH